MNILYHIQVSCLFPDPSQVNSIPNNWSLVYTTATEQAGYWSLVLTNDLNEVINVAHDMKTKLKDRMKEIQNVKNYQTIIAIVKDNNKDSQYITIQELYAGQQKFTIKDINFDNPTEKVEKCFIFHDLCYRDDTV